MYGVVGTFITEASLGLKHLSDPSKGFAAHVSS